MIRRFKKIKNLGIISDFAWSAKVPPFGRYNLMYGWNGSGKTTLSKLLASLEQGSVPGYPDLEYEVETDAGIIKSGEPLPARIKVFNQDYVARNVHTVSGRAKPILILGEENKKIADAIAADEVLLVTRKEQLRTVEASKGDRMKRRDRLFSDVAKTIGQNTAGLATRTYRKPDAERDLAALPAKALLDDESVLARAQELKQNEQPDVAPVTISVAGKPLAALTDINSQGTDLCTRTVVSQPIPRLKENPDIAAWVEQGSSIHRAHSSKACEFCGQPLAPERMSALAAHFNEADKALKADVDTLLAQVGQLEQALGALRTPERANLYDELRTPYQRAADSAEAARKALLRDVAAFRKAVEEKRGRTTEQLGPPNPLDASAVLAGIEAVNTEIRRHNAKTADFKAIKAAAQKALEAHYLSTIYDEAQELKQQIQADEDQANKVTTGDPGIPGDVSIGALEERVVANRAKISSSHKGCQEINAALHTFLGRAELQFEVDGDGYVLKRGKVIAEGLSEGERTAIGVVHFIINLKEEGFDPADGIIVVDDPVSSLDSNSLFQAFAFLKNAVKDAKQVFFLTHDFDFLRLLLNWVKSARGIQAGYHMISDAYGASGTRAASIGELDKLLRDHETEYHYLFKRLARFETDGTLESVYDIPNIARKVLESFLMFRVPSNQNPYQKMEALKPYFDENKLTGIYKFTNDESHMTGKGFDPSLVAETQKNVKHLLEMINAVFPEHYTILMDSIKDT